MISPGAGKTAMKRHDRVEQTIDRQALGLEVDAETAGREQSACPTRSRCTQGSCRRRDTTRGGMSCSVTTRPYVSERSSPSTGSDPIDEHERLVGQANTRGMTVDRGIRQPRHRADGAHRELQALHRPRKTVPAGASGWLASRLSCEIPRLTESSKLSWDSRLLPISAENSFETRTGRRHGHCPGHARSPEAVASAGRARE